MVYMLANNLMHLRDETICNCGEIWWEHNWNTGKSYKEKTNGCTGFVEKKGAEMRVAKVGDRIRLVDPERYCIISAGYEEGSIHTVEKVDGKKAYIGCYLLNASSQYDGEVKVWEFADEETKEKLMFKIGDVIRCKNDTRDVVGTVIKIHGPDSAWSGCVETGDWLNKASEFELVRRAEEEIEVTPRGGKHTAIGRAYHHFPPHAMRLMAETLHKGALKYNRPYEVMNWKNISKEDHHNHALNHIFLALENNETEDYVNAALRGIMALEMHLEEKGTV